MSVETILSTHTNTGLLPPLGVRSHNLHLNNSAAALFVFIPSAVMPSLTEKPARDL